MRVRVCMCAYARLDIKYGNEHLGARVLAAELAALIAGVCCVSVCLHSVLQCVACVALRCIGSPPFLRLCAIFVCVPVLQVCGECVSLYVYGRLRVDALLSIMRVVAAKLAANLC